MEVNSMCHISSQPAYELLLLTTKAAFDISNLISGRGKNLTAMQDLSKELNQLIREKLKYKNVISLNTAVIHLFNEAIKGMGKTLMEVDELPDEIARIIEILNNPMVDKPEELRKIQDFCLALSRSIMSYRKENFSYRFQF